jgi:hypothetical protein
MVASLAYQGANMSAGSIRKTNSPGFSVAESVRWLRFLSRWSLLSAMVTLALTLLLTAGVGQQAADSALGAQYAELLQAVRSPGLYRGGWTLDALAWLMIGGSLLGLAGVLRRRTPLRAAFIAVSGLAQLFGALGGFLRVQGISELAALYAAAGPERQILLLASYQDLWRVLNAHFYLGVLFQGVGFALASWGALSLRGFPRWLAAWIGLPGVLALAQSALVTAGASFWRPLNIIGVIVGSLLLNLALAAILWRPSPALVSAVADEPAPG